MPPVAPSTTATEGVSFGEAAREALKTAEELFPEEHLAAMPNPTETLVEDPHLRVEDFLAEERAHPAPSESDASLKTTLPTPG